jgi:hypothetical protein
MGSWEGREAENCGSEACRHRMGWLGFSSRVDEYPDFKTWFLRVGKGKGDLPSGVFLDLEYRRRGQDAGLVVHKHQ